MKNIAPDIFRQRLLIEGYFTIEITEAVLRDFLLKLADYLSLRTYSDPIIFSPASGMGSDENAGFDAFVPLIDSGISAYVWSRASFFSIVLYTCKGFDVEGAIAFTCQYLGVTEEVVSTSF